MNYSIYKKFGKEKATKYMLFLETDWNQSALKMAKVALQQIREAYEPEKNRYSVEQPTSQRLIVKDAKYLGEEYTIQYFIKREKTTRP